MTQTIVLTGDYRRSEARRLIDLAPPNAVVTVKPPTRSLDQNSKLWAMLSDVSRAKPDGREYPPEIWKNLFMAMVGREARWEPALDGNGVVNVGYRSSRLSKDEMSELIEGIAAWAAERGIELKEAA